MVSGLHYLRTSNEEELLRSSRVTARLFATMISDAVVASDLATLDVLVEQTLKNEGIEYLRVRSAEGRQLAAGGDSAALAAPFVADRSIADTESDRRLDVAAPIAVAGVDFGQVELGMSAAKIDATLTDARRWMLSVASMEIALVALFGLLLGGILTRQLALLRVAARRVAAGEFGYTLPVRGRDELADTTESFNTMSQALADFAREAEAARIKAEAARDRAETVLNDAMDSMPQGVVIVNEDETVEFANAAFRQRYPETAGLLAQSPPFADLCAATLPHIKPKENMPLEHRVRTRLDLLRSSGVNGQWESRHVDGGILQVTQSRMSNGGVVVVENDVTELETANERNRRLEVELMHKQKMESLGTLAGGIAHEINTPIQYVGDNIRFVRESFDEIRAEFDTIAEDDPLQAILSRIDWGFLRDEVPSALTDADSGVQAVIKIVRSVTEFSHPESAEKTRADLREIIENTLTVSRNQWKYAAEVECSFDETLGDVPCFPGELAQVLINLIVNAAQAIEEHSPGQRGRIVVATAHAVDAAEITVTDNGPGIPADKLGRVFDLFFTTKAPGAGTGQGLAICKSIIETKHGGSLTVESPPGEGARFIIRLPLATAAAEAA